MMPILLPCFGSSESLKLFGALRDQLRIVDHDLAGIDVPDAVRILHRRDQVLGVRHLGIVDGLGNARLVHLEHLRGRKALDVAGAARQALLGHHLGAARAVAGLVLRDVEALRLEQRVLDVLGEQARIVAAPGADDDAPALRLRGAAQQGRHCDRAEAQAQRVTTREVCLSCSTPPFVQLALQRPFRRRAASRPRPSSPTAGAASPRFASCTTTRSAGDSRTCSSSTAPR